MASNLIRYMAHPSGRVPATSSNGKAPSALAAGTFYDLPDNSNDNALVQANGYTKVGYVGTTAQRPATPSQGMPYVDTTLSKLILFDGAAWRDPISGATV